MVKNLMSFLKTFAISLVTLLVTNLLLVFIIWAIFGHLDFVILIFTGDFISLFYNLFCSMGHAIWISIDIIAYHITNDNLYFVFLKLIIIIAPLIVAIITGRFAEKRIHSLLSLILTSVISMIVSLILMFISTSYQIIITSSFIGAGALFIEVLGSLLNGLIFGLLAYFTTKK